MCSLEEPSAYGLGAAKLGMGSRTSKLPSCNLVICLYRWSGMCFWTEALLQTGP